MMIIITIVVKITVNIEFIIIITFIWLA